MNLSNLKIGIHQINTVTGDIEGNLKTIKGEILNDKNNNVDISIFPETAITGYMCGSLWDRTDFCDKQDESIDFIQEYIQEIKYKGIVIIGFAGFLELKRNSFPRLKNAAAIISEDLIQMCHKQLLASSDHHDDKHYFDKGKSTTVSNVNLPNIGKIRIGVLICEDAWTNDHKRSIPAEMVGIYGADLLININQSYFYYGKQEKRIEQFSKNARLCKVPFITVNSCGIGDILKNIVIFDGGSMIFNELGELIYEAPRFKQHNEIVTYGNLNNINHIEIPKYEEIFNALVFEQKELFRLLGIQKAQVHISGGIDSAVVAVLVKEAMNDNIVFITNPSDLNSNSLKYVNHLQNKLNVEILTNPIQTIFNHFMEVHKDSFHKELSKTGQATVQSTLRTVQGLAASHQFNSGIVAAGNHTEIVLGWASFHDIGSIGVHSIIGDLTKVEVFNIASYINEKYNDEIIPEDLFNGKFTPAAELPDADKDPIDYSVQSGICALLIRERKSKEQIMYEFNKLNNDRMQIQSFLTTDLFPDLLYLMSFSHDQFEKEVDFAISRMKKSVYKAAQGAPIVIISPRSRGFSNRETLLNFY